ncbi:MAG: DUF3325 family protein [Gammaproteobacteria bacterium]|nr:DUF3325 family protein [Gammaproteobacteria bacterium]
MMIFLLYFGLMCILVSMPSYQKVTLLDGKLNSLQKNIYFFLGWFLVLLTLFLLIQNNDVVMGLIQFCALMSLCSTVLIFVFSYAPNWVIWPIVFSYLKIEILLKEIKRECYRVYC